MKTSHIFVLSLLAMVFVVMADDPVTGGYGPERVYQQSGYITVPGYRNDNGSHIFYWFFEARQSPETAPLLFWFSGGPGCSGLTALFFENGPYLVENDLSLTLNPYSWNSIANVLWIDQPVGTGFSWSDSVSDYTTNEEEVSTDLYQFLQIFLQRNPKYANRPFFIAGESYAGHFNSHFSSYIVRKNNDPRTTHKINFQGVAIGNGWVDPLRQYAQYGNFMHKRGFLTKGEVDTYNNYTYPGCKKLIESGDWKAAIVTCQFGMLGVYTLSQVNAGRTINIYDVRYPCDVAPLCYNMSNIRTFLNQPNVKSALGVPLRLKWDACIYDPMVHMASDWIPSFAQDLPSVLQSGVSVLVYYGVEDFICSDLGGKSWVQSMVWPGQNGFASAPLQNWLVNGAVAGRSQSFSGLTWLEIDKAGHLAPHDQPANTLDMLSRFLHHKPFA